MALGGAWVAAMVGSNIVRMTGRTFAVVADAAAIGLFGDGTADGNVPAAWYGNGQTGAALVANTIVVVKPVTDSIAGAVAGGMFRVVKAAGPPFQITLTWDGDTPTAAVEPEVYIIWPHSAIQ